MIQISICGIRKLQGPERRDINIKFIIDKNLPETNVVKSLIINAVRFISVLDKLMD